MATFIHPTAVIGPNVLIGNDVYIGPYCIIGYPAEWKGNEHIDMGVIIGNGARLTGLVTVDSGVNGPTIVGKDCYLMKHSHVGHDVMMGDNVTVSCGAKIGGHAEIGDRCNIGLNACIHQKVKVPPGCMIGMGAVVTKTLNMFSNAKYAGVPAKYIGRNDI